eukprot:COSAG01_NODE_1118_length_11634_cov_21.281838_2_plen_127_part_00
MHDQSIMCMCGLCVQGAAAARARIEGWEPPQRDHLPVKDFAEVPNYHAPHTPEEQRAVWLRWWRAKQSREAHRRKREAEEAARFPAEEPYLPELDDEAEPAAHEYEASRERQELRRRLHRRQMGTP